MWSIKSQEQAAASRLRLRLTLGIPGLHSAEPSPKKCCLQKAEFKVMSLAKVKTAEPGTHHVLNRNSPAYKLEMQFIVELNHHQ